RPAWFRTTCTNWTGLRALPISKSTTRARANCTGPCPRVCQATWCPGWCARSPAPRASVRFSDDWTYTGIPEIEHRAMSGTDHALRLMIVDDSVEDAEAIVSTLRNAGIAVRPLRPDSAESLAGMLADQAVDLVLAAQAATTVTLAQALELIKATGKDLPVVTIVDRVDDASLTQALAAGVRGIALRHQPQQMLGVVRTEWGDLEARRTLRKLEAQVRETERRCDALIESSRDPIAYIHEGMHIRANAAYMEMFDFESFDDLEGMSLLDLVAPKHVDGFK